MHKLLLAAFVAAIPAQASAVTLQMESPACDTLGHISELIEAASELDQDAVNHLARRACTVSDHEAPVTVLGLDPTGMYAHVRAWRGKRSVLAWVPTVALIDFDPDNP